MWREWGPLLHVERVEESCVSGTGWTGCDCRLVEQAIKAWRPVKEGNSLIAGILLTELLYCGDLTRTGGQLGPAAT